VRIREPYGRRQIRMLQLWHGAGWRLKLYGIAWGRDAPAPSLAHVAKQLAAGILPHPPQAEGRYGVGFIGVHQGRGADLVFVDWWSHENELQHHVWVTRDGGDGELEYATGSGLAACVWDLAVIGFERQAWIDHVLAARVPDLDAYLAAALDGWV
jgi:hypothetical protein